MYSAIFPDIETIISHLFVHGLPCQLLTNIIYRSTCVTFGGESDEEDRRDRLITIGIFIAVYVLPVCCLLVFYSSILRKLFVHVRSMSRSSIPLRKVSSYISGLLLFHFLSWTPYWLFVVNFAVFQFLPDSDYFVYVMYFVHALPYVNSALNWIFYAFLNSQFRTSYSQANRAPRLLSRAEPQSRADPSVSVNDDTYFNIRRDGKFPENDSNCKLKLLGNSNCSETQKERSIQTFNFRNPHRIEFERTEV